VSGATTPQNKGMNQTSVELMDACSLSPVEILLRLHLALRTGAIEHELSAVAVCEDVSITPAEGKQTKAVKVLIEHRRGLTVALYLPWKRKMGHVWRAR
jgi:hypothetical protein